MWELGFRDSVQELGFKLAMSAQPKSYRECAPPIYKLVGLV